MGESRRESKRVFASERFGESNGIFRDRIAGKELGLGFDFVVFLVKFG